MNTLTHYMSAWSLSAPEIIAETHTSTVYRAQRAGQPVVLKVLNDVGIHDEARGALALQHFNGQGAARLLKATEDAHLLEYLHGDDLVALVTAGRDDEAADIIAETVKALHSVPQDTIPTGLHTLRRRFRSLFKLAETTTNSTLIHGAQVAEKILADEREKVVLHGDIHHENIKQSPRGWLAFDPKGLYGERTYDVANALFNPAGMPHITGEEARLLRHVRIYADALDIAYERVLHFAFAHGCLSISWSIEDGQAYDSTLAIVHLLEKHV